MTTVAAARDLLDRARTRGDIKRLAPLLDGEDGDAWRAVVLQEGRRRGADLPDDAVGWPAKKLLRLARARREDSVQRGTPVTRDEAFVCAHCGREVPPAGRTARDHCPWCLRSVHLDVVPGDRAAGCGGRMDPVSLEVRGADLVLTYRCARCGHTHRVRALQDGSVPDDPAALRLVSRGELP